MRFSPRTPDIGPKDGFSKENDLFKFADFGKRFSSVVNNLDHHTTILFDGPWGSGKSTFIRQWAGLLRQQHTPVIEFDAFANDHNEDAFVSLASEIISFGQDEENVKAEALGNVLSSAKKAGAALLPIAARIGIRAASFGILNSQDVQEADELVRSTINEFQGAGADAIEKALQRRLQNTQDERNTIAEFKRYLEELVGQVLPESGDTPEAITPQNLVFIIDELDRCRPPFAINLLERIKHFFSVPNIVFVLVTNLTQLEAAVRGAYGQDTDAHLYLEKFYDLRVTLPQPGNHRRKNIDKYINHLWEDMEIGIVDLDIDSAVKHLIGYFAEIYGLSLRTLERIAAHIALAYAACGDKYPVISVLISGLSVMRQVNPALYSKATQGNLRWDEAEQFFQLSEWEVTSEKEFFLEWWRYCIDSDVDESLIQRFGTIMRKLGLSSRGELLPSMTSLIDGFSFV